MEPTTIPTTLAALIDWGLRIGVALFAVWAVNKLKADWLTYDVKVALALLVTSVLAIGLWLFGMYMGYIAWPEPTPQKWIEGGANVVLSVIVLNLGEYAILKGRAQRAEAREIAASYRRAL